MANLDTGPEPQDSRWNLLRSVGGVAALVLGLLLLAAMIDPIATYLGAGAATGWLAPFQANWLVVLFELDAGFVGVGFDLLTQLNALDIAIVALVGVTYLGLWVALRRVSRIWPVIGAAMPLLGIPLFVATETAGRSGVMGGGLVISCVMLRSNTFGRLIAVVGILANSLLLVGDLGTAADSPSFIVAVLVGIGYVLLTGWFFVVGIKLLRPESTVAKKEGE